MKRSFPRPLLFLLIALLAAIPVMAQRQTGAISGRVLDAQNNPLPGVAVTLSGPALMGSQDFVTTETGAFRFVALSPGRDYQIKAALPGFKTTIRPGLIVSVGRTTDTDIILEESAVSEEVTVTAPSPVVDVQATKTNVNYSAQLLASLPMNRDLYDIQNSIPGAISEGIEYRRMSSIQGGTVRSQLYALDGVPLNDPATNYSMANINIDVYEEIEFETGGHPAEVGQTDSTYINIVTKSGGNRLSGGVTGYYTAKGLSENLFSDEQLRAFGVNPPEKYTGYKDLSLNLGGPIIKDKIWFFLNGRRLTFKEVNPFTPENRMAALGLPTQHYDMDHQEWMGFGKLTFQITPNIKYFGMLHYNHIYEPVYKNSFGSDADFSYTRIWDHENTYTTTHQVNWILNQNTFLDIRGTYVWRVLPPPLPQRGRIHLLRQPAEGLLGDGRVQRRVRPQEDPGLRLGDPVPGRPAGGQPRIQGRFRVRTVRVPSRLVQGQSLLFLLGQLRHRQSLLLQHGEPPGAPPHPHLPGRARPMGRPGPHPPFLRLPPGQRQGRPPDLQLRAAARPFLPVRAPAVAGPSSGTTTARSFSTRSMPAPRTSFSKR